MTDVPAFDIDYKPLIGTLEKLDANEVVELASEQWFNRTLAQVDEAAVRIGVFQGGEFPWHKHDDEDEFFFVLDGRVRLDLEDRPSVELGPRQCFTVPKGLLHRPVVSGPATVLMVERAGVVATGDA